MSNLLEKGKYLKNGMFVIKLSKQEVEEEFYEICDRVHASCNWECPIFEYIESLKQKRGVTGFMDCPFHKNGQLMAYIALNDITDADFEKLYDVEMNKKGAK